MNKDEFITELADLLSVDESELTNDVALEKLEDWDSLAVIGFIALLDKKLGKKMCFLASCRQKSFIHRKNILKIICLFNFLL